MGQFEFSYTKKSIIIQNHPKTAKLIQSLIKSDNKEVIKDTGTGNTGVNENAALIIYVAIFSLLGFEFAINAKKAVR